MGFFVTDVTSMPLITGAALLTPLGTTLHETWASLLRGDSITAHARVPLPMDERVPRVTQLALEAATEALDDAEWKPALRQDERTALIVATSKGPVEAWLTALSHIDESAYVTAGQLDLGLSETAQTIGRRLGFGSGPRLTLSAACASGLHALIRAGLMIRAGEAHRVLVVAAESSLHSLFLSSFQRLGVLPREGNLCRPFDRNRDGFLMSEAAAAVCVEAEPVSTRSRPWARIERSCLAGDATHLTGIDPDAASLRYVLCRTIHRQYVDLVHAHGTATDLNDPLELASVESAMPETPSRASLYSHKGAIGHSLGAAGLVSVVLNCMMHRCGTVPPNVNTPDPLPARRLCIDREAQSRAIRRSLVIAAGFGGPTAAVSLVSP